MKCPNCDNDAADGEGVELFHYSDRGGSAVEVNCANCGEGLYEFLVSDETYEDRFGEDAAE